MVNKRSRTPEATTRGESPGIMTKPLPQILDEMEANIRAAAEAAKKAEEAAKAARGAAGAATTASIEAGKRAEEARLAGESAADTATRAANEAATKAENTAMAAREVAEGAARKAEEVDIGARHTAEAFEKAAEAATRASKEAAAEAVREGEEAIKTELLPRIEMLEKRLKNIEDTSPKQQTIILREITKEEAMQEIEELFKKGDTLFYSDIAEKLHIDLELVVDICEELIKKGKVEIANAS